ncbi:N-methyl-L-tryptophan oxidase [Rathayibacter sp. VKM Ac-2803]|uniref:N-methyl-L-tryptophan oxidase n=1 Tax=unclassified Rathayibacter TaxID=2609250 RepID=UPI0013586D85|nr:MULTISPECIES: N-methyl-L-tryptophan oxidase [unclassified Rathayibacter]MWV48890.1 N-methyl-L-tryptophan oxidase [Rathayibacter sp. VKM Ac-2803]MWV58621.1 N-methyl-L-tryptophan oxidase [Rathayibacter sp. VKM Ac-2754]
MTGRDVVVVGAGIVGAAAARTLAERGDRVLVLERFERGHDRGSSHGETRIFRRGYVEDDYRALTGRAATEWARLEAESGRRLFTPTGAIDHGDASALLAIEEAFARDGIPVERLDAAEASRRWPGLRFETDVLLHPEGGRLDAAAAIEALLESAQAHGATVRASVGVHEIRERDGGVRLVTDEGPITADAVVVAAGSWTPGLVGDLVSTAGLGIPEVRVTQEEPAHFATGLDGWPSFVHHRGALPTIYGLATPGVGVKVGEHGTGRVIDPDQRGDRRPEPEALARLQRYVAEWVPGADAASADPISCLYDTTPTEDFVLDRVGRVTLATGFSGHGFKFGPVLGELLADLADGAEALERFRLTPS